MTGKRHILAKEEVIEEPKEYMVLLMRNNGYSEFIQDVKAGEFLIASSDGKEEKSITLTPSRLTTFKYGKQYVKGWVCHEDNAFPLPEDPIFGAEMFRKIVQKLSMNYKDANEIKFMEAKRKQVVFYIMIIVLGS